MALFYTGQDIGQARLLSLITCQKRTQKVKNIGTELALKDCFRVLGVGEGLNNML